MPIEQIENYYVIAPVKLLDVPIKLDAFRKTDEQGNPTDEYMSVREYEAQFNHTIDRFNKDKSLFCKGFEFNWKKQLAVFDLLKSMGLIEDQDFKFLNAVEVAEEMQKPDWAEGVDDVSSAD